ncbi:XdhC/CoxI family protein [Nesterenkonia sp.]|uniref:XdhC family protein n=1 Tax=Nesterenkonia sp. TaxID=704201 RepID=UPI00261DD2E5|nr:XdhC/CoxI family protein [Nesterenkonia sp.]
MREVASQLRQQWEADQPVALATVVSTFRSAPREPGAAMLITGRGEVLGSVSGGCVESAVYTSAQEVLATGAPRLERYGITDGDAFAVGLTCGGTLEVFIERITAAEFPELGDILDDVQAGRPVGVATVVDHPDHAQVGRRTAVRLPEPASPGCSPGDDHRPGAEPVLGWADRRAEAAAAEDMRAMLRTGRSGILEYGPAGQRQGAGQRIFVSSFAAPDRMLIFGAIDFAASVAQIGSFLGYRVTVCDARPVFATAQRFPAADEVVVQWPDDYLRQEKQAGRVNERTVICVLTHEPTVDVPVLQEALNGPAVGYIGVMGSRRTHRDRLQRLREAGLSEEQLARLASPIGLDLGGRTPAETALSIGAEIVAHRHGGSGLPLSRRSGPIHRAPVGLPAG